MTKKVAWGVVSLFLLILFFCCIGVGLISFSQWRNKNASAKSIYEIRRFNPTTNKTSIGSFTSSNVVSEGDFMAFTNQAGEFVTISGVSGKEYECTADCVCELDGRRSALVVKNALFFIVSAISTTMAMSIAKEYFRDRCNIIYDKDPTDSDDDDDDEDFEAKCAKLGKTFPQASECRLMTVYNKFNRKMFSCTGHCVENPICIEDEVVKIKTREVRKKFDCPKHVLTKEVMTDGENVDEDWDMFKAVTTFLNLHLRPFCHGASEYTYTWLDNLRKWQPDLPVNRLERTIPICCGLTVYGEYNGYKNIECKYVESIPDLPQHKFPAFGDLE